MRDTHKIKNTRNPMVFLLNALLMAFLFVINISAFDNGIKDIRYANKSIQDICKQGTILGATMDKFEIYIADKDIIGKIEKLNKKFEL